MLKLIVGRAGTGKTTRILKQLCKQGEERPQVLIVPEQQSHEMERLLCQFGGDQGSLWGEVLSFSRLAHRIFQTAGGLCHPELDAGGRLLLMYHAVKTAAPNLTVYSRPSRKPSFLQSLLATVDELKSCCVSPDQLRLVGEELAGESGNKLQDLGLICSIYQGMTNQTALDPKDRLTRAAEKLSHCSWAREKDIWLDGFTDFTPQQELVLRQLLRQAESVTVTLTCDHLEEDEQGDGIFSTARRTAASLIRLAKEGHIPYAVETLTTGPEKKAPGLRHLEQNLFAYGMVERGSAQGAVELFRARGIRSEVEWVAARIRQLVREYGLRYREIGVVTRDYALYQDHVETIFPRYEIPVFSSAMVDILEKPILTLVTAALDTVANQYRYDDLFRYLKTGLTDLPQEDRDCLENYVLTWNIRGSRWTQHKAWSWHPEGYGHTMEEEDQVYLARIDGIRRRVIEPLEQLRTNPDQTGYGQAVALYRFLEQIGLPERLENKVAQLKEQGKLQLSEEYRQLWEILCGGLEQCAALLGETPMELEEFTQLFRLVLSQYDVGTIPVSLDRVTAGEMMRQTGHPVRVLFLMGADDSSIPHVGATPGLLSEDDRSILVSYGLGLKQSQREMLDREMTTVYQICARPSEKLVISWAAQGSAGEEQRPSFLAERIQRLYTDISIGREDGSSSLRLEAPLPALEQAGQEEHVRNALRELGLFGPELERLERAASWNRGRLSSRTVQRLYGKSVSLSASKMDQIQSCHFSYFMRYGLKAEPRKTAGFSAPEYGNFVHHVLERVLQDDLIQGRKGGDGSLSQEEWSYLKTLTEQAIAQYVKEELGGLEDQSERFQYLFRRLTRAMHSVVENVVEELLSSKFRPISFELGFGEKGALPPVQLTVDHMTIRISGFVDRVDGWESNGKLYLRVVDYKTGRKSFDLTEVWNGLGLQMLVYLFALEQQGEGLYRRPVESSGVLYLPARDAVVKGSRTMSQEQWRKQMDKELVRSGLIVDEPEIIAAMETAGKNGFRFLPLRVAKGTGEIKGDALVSAQRLGRLGRHVQQILQSIAQELGQGNITADPYWRGTEKNACRYCDYTQACHFEHGAGGDHRRWLPKLSAEEFWEHLERGEEDAISID